MLTLELVAQYITIVIIESMLMQWPTLWVYIFVTLLVSQKIITEVPIQKV